MGSHTNPVGTKKKLVIINRKSSPVRKNIKMLGGAMVPSEFKNKSREEQNFIIRQFLRTKGYPDKIINSTSVSRRIKNRRCGDKNNEDYIRCVLYEVAKQIINRECNNKGDTEARLANKLQSELVSSLSGRATTPMAPSTPTRAAVIPQQQTSFSQTINSERLSHSMRLAAGNTNVSDISKILHTNSEVLSHIETKTNTVLELSLSLASQKAAELEATNSELAKAYKERKAARASNKDISDLSTKISELEKEKNAQSEELMKMKQENEQLKQLQQKNEQLEKELLQKNIEVEKAKQAGNNKLSADKAAEIDEINKKLTKSAEESAELTRKIQQELQEEKQQNLSKKQEMEAELSKIKDQKATNNAEKTAKDKEMAELRAKLAEFEKREKEREDAEAKLKAEQEKLQAEQDKLEENPEIIGEDESSFFSTPNKIDDIDEFISQNLYSDTPIDEFLKNLKTLSAQKNLSDRNIKQILLEILDKIAELKEFKLSTNISGGSLIGGTLPEEKTLNEALIKIPENIDEVYKTENINELLDFYAKFIEKKQFGVDTKVIFPEITDDNIETKEEFEKFYEQISKIPVSEKPKPAPAKPIELPTDLLNNSGEGNESEKYQKAMRILNRLSVFFEQTNTFDSIFFPSKEGTNKAKNSTTYNIADTNKDNVEQLITKLNEIIAKLNEGKAESDKIPTLDTNNLVNSFSQVMEAIKKGMDAENEPKITPQIMPQPKLKYSEATDEQKKELLAAYQTFIKSANNTTGKTEFLTKCKELNIDCFNDTDFEYEKEKIKEDLTNKQNQALILSSSSSEQKLSDEANQIKEDFKNNKTEEQKKEIDTVFKQLVNEIAKVNLPKGTNNSIPTANEYKKAYTDFSNTFKTNKTETQKNFIDYFIGEYTKKIGVSVQSDNKLQAAINQIQKDKEKAIKQQEADKKKEEELQKLKAQYDNKATLNAEKKANNAKRVAKTARAEEQKNALTSEPKQSGKTTKEKFKFIKDELAKPENEKRFTIENLKSAVHLQNVKDKKSKSILSYKMDSLSTKNSSEFTDDEINNLYNLAQSMVKYKSSGGKLITHRKSDTHKKRHTHKRLQMVPQTLKLARRHK